MGRDFTVETSTVINRDIESVFAYLTEIENIVDWLNDISAAEHESGEPGTEGAVYTVQQSFMGNTGEVALTLETVEAPSRLVLDIPAESMAFTSELLLAETTDGTLVTNIIEGEIRSTSMAVLNTVIGPVLRWLARREMQEELEALKTILEGQAATDEAEAAAAAA